MRVAALLPRSSRLNFEFLGVVWLTSLRNRASGSKTPRASTCVLATAFIRGRMKRGLRRQRSYTFIRTTALIAAPAFPHARLRRSILPKTYRRGGRNLRRSTLSGMRLRQPDSGLCRQRPHDLFEHLPSVLVALELIEAGAGGGQQHDVAGLRHGIGLADGIL